MFHQPHASIARPALLVVVADDVLVVWVGVLSQVALDQISRFLRRESAQCQLHNAPSTNSPNKLSSLHS